MGEQVLNNNYVDSLEPPSTGLDLADEDTSSDLLFFSWDTL